MLKNYLQVRDWLEGFIPQTYSRKNLRLERIEYLLKLLGNPEKKFKSIHVGGTAGKGTTAFYISEILKNKKYKVGLHISPHLIYLGERMQINGKTIDLQRLIGLANDIKPFVERMRASQVGFPSYFEILVAMSFKYFADEKVDFAVVEVGLGGKYDATNVLLPKISVITNIGLDHTEILGDTVEKIAHEKAGIIKKNTPIVTGAHGKALKVIEKVAKDNKSQLININTQLEVEPLKFDVFKSFSVPRGNKNGDINKLALFNERLAYLVVKLLKINVDNRILQKVFGQCFPGRMEEIDNNIILDGAHNEDKIDYLISRLKALKTRKISLVVAFKRGKQWKIMIDQLIKNLPIYKIVTTQFSAVTDMGKFATLEASEIEKYIKKIKNQEIRVRSIKNSHEAVFEAVKNRKVGEIVLVTGSLYLVGEARTLWYPPKF